MHFKIYEQKYCGLLSAATSGGDYRWRLIANNSRIVVDSGEGYLNKADCQHGVNLVKGTAFVTFVVDSTVSGALSDLFRACNTSQR